MLSFMDKLSNNTVYSCLLLEGIFLHRLIAAAFKGEPKMLYYYLGASGKTDTFPDSVPTSYHEEEYKTMHVEYLTH